MVTPPETLAHPRTAASTNEAVSDDATECDRLTAPKDLIAPLKRTVAETQDFNHVISVCQSALKLHPGEPHFHHALGVAYFRAKNYVEAAREYRIAADAGMPAAENSLGHAYYNGLGVVRNDQKAFELWSKAAASGWPSAMGNLGTAYADGIYVKKDFAKSLDWSEKAIEAGNILSLSVVGNAYLNGKGVERDFSMASQYFQQAADLGDGFALKTLANMNEAGFFGRPDLEKAGALRFQAQQLDPYSPDPSSVSVFKQIYAASRAPAKVHRIVHQRRYVIYRPYHFGGGDNPAWQAAPGDTRCCPQNMLVCPLGRHWC
jgi:tetratricopeptide (TPR) repeat protein